MLTIFKSIILAICCFGLSSHAYKILAFLPFPGNSHHNIFFSLIKVLADRGHSITYYTPIEPSTTHKNITLHLTKNFKPELFRYMDVVKLGRVSIPHMSYILSDTAEAFSEEYYGNEVAQEIIHSTEKYDAVIMESFFSQEPVSALVHKFGCAGIEVSTLGDSTWISEFAGTPYNPAYQVDFKTKLYPDMSFFERLYNVYAIASTLLVNHYYLYRMEAVMDKYFRYPGWESRPPLATLVANRSIILMNSDPVLNFPYPLAPHMKDIAGINVRPNQPLPKDIQEFMEKAQHGVIYFSFGSNLNTSEMMSGKVGEAFINFFKTIPQRVLMKWEGNVQHIELTPNVKTAKWFPQGDILAHKNCILFVTHGGYLSQTEAVFNGVPIIGVPIFGDQAKNIVNAEKSGYGLLLDYKNITSRSVSWAFNELINNKRYRNEAQRRSQILRTRRHSADEEAVYWVEHAIKYPNFLTPRSAFMSFWEKRVFDVGTFGILLVCIIYILVSLYFILRKKLVGLEKLKVA